METPIEEARPEAVVERLCQATNDHDLEALSSCFALDYRNETPVHPARGFQGRGQVRKNWEQIFAAVPDLTAQMQCSPNGDVVWSEWEMRGTRRDGARHLMRGVVIFGVEHGQATWARFYLEPVEEGGGNVDEAVRRAVVVGSGQESGSGPPGRGGER
ncbi:nuclear transport factor 2 family protein [Candidatus Nephthysia bennettiae]|uniref:Nuclear transport factor 2 family protein n=1 Tax=Candidatus Nephthysia bennettiae TaxID=3127016 RepID=A0A934JZ04_9BACT|nr:nuclear transport factor 2 family protein [Candidatus Dormibacteraeota bacterium]MBJ7610957.1 nuclear transport factor 2 family protein [Candidatus Dormibacteraeota bacterium]